MNEATLARDSSLDKNAVMSQHCEGTLRSPPKTLPRAFRVEGLDGDRLKTLRTVEDNAQRLVRIHVAMKLAGLRFTLDATWGAPETKVFAFYFD